MKNVIWVIIIAFTCSCNKKKAAEPATPVPTPVVPTISVKVDGVEKHCSTCYYGSTSGGLRGAYFNLAGFDEQIYFSCGTLPAPGTYSLVKYGTPYLMYSKNNANRPATTGTINISSIDTSTGGVINKMKATFAFKTDTSTTGTSYNITEGTINLN